MTVRHTVHSFSLIWSARLLARVTYVKVTPAGPDHVIMCDTDTGSGDVHC